MTQTQSVSHNWEEETAEAKALWFQSLSLTERMNMFCWFTDMILSANPRIVEQKDAKPIAGRVLVLTKAQSPVRNHRRGRRDLTRSAANHPPLTLIF